MPVRSQVCRLALEHITRDARLQGRELKQAVVDDYVAAMRRGERFPAIRVIHDDNDNYFLVDGYHRVAAAERINGINQIDAEIVDGTFDDALWLSWAANRSNGVRRTRDQLRRAVKAALQHPRWGAKSAREIARHIGCDHKTVAAMRCYMRRESQAGEFPNPKLKRRPSLGALLKACEKLASADWEQFGPFDEDELTIVGAALDSLNDFLVISRALAA